LSIRINEEYLNLIITIPNVIMVYKWNFNFKRLIIEIKLRSRSDKKLNKRNSRQKIRKKTFQNKLIKIRANK